MNLIQQIQNHDERIDLLTQEFASYRKFIEELPLSDEETLIVQREIYTVRTSIALLSFYLGAILQIKQEENKNEN